MAAKHTPGPWRARLDYQRHWISAGTGRKAVQVADVTDIEVTTRPGEVDTDNETTAANAALIAAAPELLAACEMALVWISGAFVGEGMETTPQEKALKAAIRKAKGGVA